MTGSAVIRWTITSIKSAPKVLNNSWDETQLCLNTLQRWKHADSLPLSSYTRAGMPM